MVTVTVVPVACAPPPVVLPLAERLTLTELVPPVKLFCACMGYVTVWLVPGAISPMYLVVLPLERVTPSAVLMETSTSHRASVPLEVA